MNKITRFAMWLLFAMSALAAAQDSAPPNSKTPTPPSFCKPCLWYAGDFNPDNSKANGVANEKDLTDSGSAVFVPFTVPKGKIWTITGAFGIVLSQINVIDPAQADWSFSKDVSTSKAGKLIKAGTSPATATVLDCNKQIDLFCLGILVKGLSVSLKAGRYWLTVVPYCTNQNDSACGSARYFLADVEDKPPLNHYGPKDVLDASYVTSKQFGFFYAPTWGASGACGGIGCDMFSAGLLGTSKVDEKFGSQ
ncbi:MAG TPA: hypothetical protein VNZ03_11470 [Terriglobales bacterium]|jgi:hypothetical protein|nr:hypothetical protein [Terriglobales bacterium]